LLPMALAGGGRFTTPGMTEHLHSNIRVIESFLPLRITCTTAAGGVLHVECRA
ncbi:RNA 3'-terminal phosphate cyclase, partial [Pseudomonas sp. MWU12-2534b]